MQEPIPTDDDPGSFHMGKEVGGSVIGKRRHVRRQKEPSRTLKEKYSVLEHASYQTVFSFSEKHASFQSGGQAGCHFSPPAN